MGREIMGIDIETRGFEQGIHAVSSSPAGGQLAGVEKEAAERRI
jgi:hypothetical protein